MKKITLPLIFILALSHFCYASEDIIPEAEQIDTQILVEDDSWEFRLSPYIWFSGFKGDVAGIPGIPVSSVDISSSQAVKDSEASFMLMFEAKKNGHGFFMDVSYSDSRSKDPLAGNLVINSKTKTTMVSVVYLYEAYNKEESLVDMFVGVRYWNIDSHLSVGGGPGILPPGDHEESWVDPILGLKGRAILGHTKFYVAAGAAVGGFGIASDLFYDLNANLGYQWSKSIGTTVGYRMYDLDYKNDGFVYDVKQPGWIIGLTWAF